MFNLKQLFRTVSQPIRNLVGPDAQTIIAEIHNEFDTASDKLLSNAKRILAGEYDIEKGQRLRSVGFVVAKKAIEARRVIETKEQKEKLAKLIEYYQAHYPNNKFITEKKVEEICKKYGLLCGTVDCYTADVPEKNLAEIENFKLRNEDMEASFCDWYIPTNGDLWNMRRTSIKTDGMRWGYMLRGRNGYPFFYQENENVAVHYDAEKMKICAPVKDFNTNGAEIKNGYLLMIPDPIVLQPVNGGYLVVSKWGLEADDSDLVNEKAN